MSLAAELIARCFAARTATHLAHLKTRSYAAHVALAEFYDAVVGLADSFAECYQGVYGVIDTYPACEICTGELRPVKELREWLAENRSKASRGQPELGNLIDELSALCDRTIYKLATLK